MDFAEPVLTRVTALLAQGPGALAGDTTQGLELCVGLTADAHIDLALYFADPRPWTARRFRPGQADWTGEVVRDDDSWSLRGAPEEDGPLWFLDARALHPGNYLTLRRPDGETLGFRIVEVRRDHARV